MEHRPERVVSPLSFWVHRHLDSESWIDARDHEPPMPGPTPGKGWPIYLVAHRGRELFFASLEEVDHAIDVLGTTHLPPTKRLAEKAGHPRLQHEHWLSRLHESWKPSKVRQELVQKLIALRERHRIRDRHRDGR